MVRYGRVLCGMGCYVIVRYGMPWYVWCGVVWHAMVYMVWYVWRGMYGIVGIVWFGMEWYSTVLYGKIC